MRACTASTPPKLARIVGDSDPERVGIIARGPHSHYRIQIEILRSRFVDWEYYGMRAELRASRVRS